MYLNEEKETVCVFDYVRDSWEVYSCVPRHITKLNKITAPFWEEVTSGKVTAARWRLNSSQVRFALERTSKPTKEQREAASIRMKQLHQKRVLEDTL